MENEKFQELVLQKLNEIGKQLTEHTGILTEHTGILTEHTGILTEHTGILTEHTGILTEHTQILRALEHASEVHKAELDNLTHTVARIEGEVKDLRNDLTTIEVVTSKNWNDIAKLKAVK